MAYFNCLEFNEDNIDINNLIYKGRIDKDYLYRKVIICTGYSHDSKSLIIKKLKSLNIKFISVRRQNIANSVLSRIFFFLFPNEFILKIDNFTDIEKVIKELDNYSTFNFYIIPKEVESKFITEISVKDISLDYEAINCLNKDVDYCSFGIMFEEDIQYISFNKNIK